MTADPSSAGQEPIHGGDLGAAEARFGKPVDGWIDLSTGIAPFSYPVDGVPAAAWRRLPEPREMAALIAAAAHAYRVSGAERAVAAPGSQALIQRLPGLFDKRARVAVVAPTYNEHARAWAAAGHAVAEVADLEGASDADVVVVVNPNNPDGRCHEPARLVDLAAALARRGGMLVVDEAFADVMPERSMAPSVGAAGLVVLRSFGKFYGLAGMRLGFALTTATLAERLRASLGPWPVSGPAIAIATRALRDDEWQGAQRARLAEGSLRLRDLLSDAGFEIVGGTDLFLLAARDDAQAVFERLARAGILVRRFPPRPTWLRFGLPGADAAWSRLAAVR